MAFLINIYSNHRHEQLLEDTYLTNGTVTHYSKLMGSPYLHYSYEVEGIEYSSSASANYTTKWLLPSGTDSLKIEYSVKDFSYSNIIDDRYTKFIDWNNQFCFSYDRFK